MTLISTGPALITCHKAFEFPRTRAITFDRLRCFRFPLFRMAFSVYFFLCRVCGKKSLVGSKRLVEIQANSSRNSVHKLFDWPARSRLIVTGLFCRASFLSVSYRRGLWYVDEAIDSARLDVWLNRWFWGCFLHVYKHQLSI